MSAHPFYGVLHVDNLTTWAETPCAQYFRFMATPVADVKNDSPWGAWVGLQHKNLFLQFTRKRKVVQGEQKNVRSGILYSPILLMFTSCRNTF
jgi:hypothetical protein